MMPGMSNALSQSAAASLVNAISTSSAILSAAFDTLDYEGLVEVVQNLGTITGSINTPKLVESDTSGGTYTDVSGATFGTTASALTSVKFSVSETKRFIKYSAGVTTGPVAVSVTLTGFKKYR